MTLKEFRSSYSYNTYSCVIIYIYTYTYKGKFNSKSIIRIKNNVYWLFFSESFCSIIELSDNSFCLFERSLTYFELTEMASC